MREWLFVREAMRHLQRSSSVFIHPRYGGKPMAMLTRLQETDDSHHHLEGHNGWKPPAIR